MHLYQPSMSRLLKQGFGFCPGLFKKGRLAVGVEGGFGLPAAVGLSAFLNGFCTTFIDFFREERNCLFLRQFL
ncbi:hypothetical protein C7N43_37590 [Sphingobacteriales bacterium UPWRP_1]|nr:hypothetical protein B6N25_08355 [Sphingobacteriales bacterium TSM_CSS]PSJ71785.1 hypothetical protein C7N43_37590 [Sphingobacteriales bacterium UPWRP_1]